MLLCRRMDRRLSFLADGELGETERARVEQHLATCPRCQQRFRAYQQTRQAVQQFEPIMYRKLTAGRRVNTWAPGSPHRRPLTVAAAAMLVALAALVPYGLRLSSELRALPWHPGYVLSGLPADFQAHPLCATSRELLIGIVNRRNQPRASLAFLRGRHLSKHRLQGPYGWDRVSLVTVANRRVYEAYKTVGDEGGTRQVYMLGWNAKGFCVLVRQEPGGSYQDLVQVVQSLAPGDRRAMLHSLHNGPSTLVSRDSLLMAP